MTKEEKEFVFNKIRKQLDATQEMCGDDGHDLSVALGAFGSTVVATAAFPLFVERKRFEPDLTVEKFATKIAGLVKTDVAMMIVQVMSRRPELNVEKLINDLVKSLLNAEPKGTV